MLVFVCLSFFGLFGFEQFRFGQTSCDRFCFVRLVLGLIGFGWTDLVFVRLVLGFTGLVLVGCVLISFVLVGFVFLV